MKKFDLIIIGAGRASNLAVAASKIGLKVALIEESKLGGTCPNRGCVPSKLLIGYAHVARAIKESSRHHITSSIQNIDLTKIFNDVNTYVEGIDGKYESKMNDNITIYKASATFVSNYVIGVNNEEITSKQIVIGTGTRPIEAPHEKAWTSNNLFPLKGKIPKSITIIGSGFIACELANFFDAVGIETKLVVRGNTLLSREDETIQEIFQEEFTQNINVAFNTTLDNIDYQNNQFSLRLLTKKGTIINHCSEALLYAVGRKSNADKLKLHNTQIEVNEKNFIRRDDFFETSVKGIYVIGDASGEHMLQHSASYEVNHLSKILLEKESKPLKFKYMPHAVFTDPEIASVGYTQRELISKNIPYIESNTNWLASAKAMSTKLTYPRIKLLVNPNNFEILGCHIIGPDSATMIHQVLAIMHIDNDIRNLKEMLYIHPAMSEALLPAAVEIIKKINEKNKI